MILDANNRVSYDGNGVAKEFSFSFDITSESDIVLLKVAPDGTETAITADYVVRKNEKIVIYPGWESGMEKDEPKPLPVGYKLIIYRNVPVTQETSLADIYPFKTIEKMIDKLTILMQQLKDSAKRALTLSVSTPSDVDTTIPAPMPLHSFRWSADGKKLETTLDPASVLPNAQSLRDQTEILKNETQGIATGALENVENALTAVGAEVQKAETASVSAKESETKAKQYLDSVESGTTIMQSAISNHNNDENAHPGLKTLVLNSGINLWTAKKSYSIGDIAYSKNLPSWAFAECKTAGATGTSEPLWSSATVGQTFTDGSCTWTIRDIKMLTKLNIADYNTDINFSFVYPNGGTLENPASIAKSTQYVCDNPFPGYHVIAIAQVYYNSQWADVTNISENGSSNTGVVAAHNPTTDKIIVSTGQDGIIGGFMFDGYPNYTAVTAINNLPCRVKVYKIGQNSQIT